jgi:hypothetical protein
MQCLNFNTEVLGTESGILLCGFCPKLQQSDATLIKILADAGIEGNGKKEEAIKLTRKWIEQDYIARVLKKVLELQHAGPIPLQIGENDKKYRCMICVRGYGCKNNVFNIKK